MDDVVVQGAGGRYKLVVDTVGPSSIELCHPGGFPFKFVGEDPLSVKIEVLATFLFQFVGYIGC